MALKKLESVNIIIFISNYTPGYIMYCSRAQDFNSIITAVAKNVTRRFGLVELSLDFNISYGHHLRFC